MLVHQAAYCVNPVNITMISQTNNFYSILDGYLEQLAVIFFFSHAVRSSSTGNVTRRVNLKSALPESGAGVGFIHAYFLKFQAIFAANPFIFNYNMVAFYRYPKIIIFAMVFARATK